MPAAAHPYFMSISHRIQRTLKNDCWALKPFSQRNKNISCDLSSWLWSMALASRLKSQQSHILLQRVSGTILIRHCVTLITESSLPLATSWLNCNHLTVRTYFLEDTPAESTLPCVRAACFTLPIATTGVGVHSHSCLCTTCSADYEYKG